MTLLTIIQRAGVDIGQYGVQTLPTTIIGTQDDNVLRPLYLLQTASEMLRDAKDSGWTALQQQNLFTTVSGQAAYPLPSDFNYILNNTWWDRTNHWALQGPLTPQEWQWYKSGIIQAGPRERFRIKGYEDDKFYLDPTPSSGLNLVWEYASASFCKSATGTAQTSWQADTDVPILPEKLYRAGLKWMWLRSIGQSYAQEKTDYDDMLEAEMSRDGGKPILTAGRNQYWNGFFLGYKNIPDGNWGL